MAYDTILSRQRQAYIAQLGPASKRLSHPELQFNYLGSLGYTQPTLLQRLHAWGLAVGIPQTKRLTSLGLVADVPPTPPGPLDLLVPGDLNGTNIPYTNTNPVLHCRIAGIKTGSGGSTITVNVDGNPMTSIGINQFSTTGTPFAAAFYVTGLTAGAHTISISVSGAALGNAAVRLGELVSQTGIGQVLNNVSGSFNYYYEFDATPNAGSIHGSVLCCSDVGAYDIYPSTTFDTEQWNTKQTGMTARFGTGDMNGEGGGLFVYYNRDGQQHFVAGLLYEIIGGVLP